MKVLLVQPPQLGKPGCNRIALVEPLTLTQPADLNNAAGDTGKAG